MGLEKAQKTIQPTVGKRPLLSIVIPTCNRGKLLASCLQGIRVAAASLPEGSCEVIVTVDGEESPDVCAAMESAAVVCVKGPNTGPASNRNNGASHATGDWLIFIDDDCIPDAQILSCYAAAIQPGVFVYEGKTTCRDGLQSALDQAPINTSGGYLWSCNFMISQDVFRRVGGFDEAFPYAAMEDVDLRERLKAAGYQIPFVSAAIVDHPPRKIRGLSELRRVYIAMAYYTVCKRGERLKMRTLLSAVLRARMRRILKAPDRTDSAKALRLLVCELMMIIRCTKSWERMFQIREHA